jgi:hypothetical protein
MHLDAKIVRVWRCMWRSRSSNSAMRLDAEVKWNSEMHLGALPEPVWRCIRRP